jgi:hypothetical protein
MGKSLVECNHDGVPLAPTQPRARATNQLTTSALDEMSPEGGAVTAFDYGLLPPRACGRSPGKRRSDQVAREPFGRERARDLR